MVIVAEIGLTSEAVEDLDRLILTHSLPADTRGRVKRSLETLKRFPRSGRELEAPWRPVRMSFGPWPWLLILYLYEERNDTVIVLGFQDARSYQAATSR